MILVAEKLHRFLPATESSTFSALPASSASPSPFAPSAPSASAEPLPQLVPMGFAVPRVTPPHLRIPPICTSPPLAGMVDSPTSPRCAGLFSPELSEPSSPLPVSFGGFGSLHDEDMPDVPIPDLHGLDHATASSVASAGDVASDCGSDSFSWGGSSAGSAASAETSDAKQLPPSSSSASSTSSSRHATSKGGYRPVHIIRSNNGVTMPVRAVASIPPPQPQRLVIPLPPAVPIPSPGLLSPSVMSQFLASTTTARIVPCPSPAPSSAPRATQVDARGEVSAQIAAPSTLFVPSPSPSPPLATVPATVAARQVSGGVDVAAWASAAARTPQEQNHHADMDAWRSLEEDMDTSAAGGGKSAAGWEVTGWFRQMAGWQALNTVDSSEEQLLPGR